MVNKDSVLGYVNTMTKGNIAYRKNAEPIFENGKYGDIYLPIRMFLDSRYKGNDVFPHMHKAIEILCMLRGSMNIVINNESYDVLEEDIILINSDDVHMIIGEDAEYYVLQIEPEIFCSYGIDICQYMPKTKKVIGSEEETNRALVKWIKEAFSHAQEYGKVARIAVLSDIFGMFSLIMAYSKQVNETTEESKAEQKAIARLKDIFGYVEAHYDEDITVDEMAEHVHLTKTYFCRFFKQSMGMTFIDYLNRYRCNKVEEMMRDTDLSITAIASQAGFKNISYFNKIYKKIRGESPSKSRKQIYDSYE